MLQKDTIQNIAVFRALQLGDLLCSIPALASLRANFPKAHISFIGIPGTRELISRFPAYIDEFIAFPGHPRLPEQAFNPEAFQIFLAEMKSRNFDLLLQMQGSGNIVNALLSTFGAKNLAGFATDKLELQKQPLLLSYPGHGHESLRHLQLLAHLGLAVSCVNMEFPLYAEDFARFARLNFKLKAPYVCLHAGSRATWRQWPVAYFAQLGDYCHLNGIQVVLTGTAEESSIAGRVANLMAGKPLSLVGKTGLGTLGVLLKQSCGLIANCTGTSHIAAGLQVPSVIISMDGEMERWAPVNRHKHFTIDWTRSADFERVRMMVTERIILPTTLRGC